MKLNKNEALIFISVLERKNVTRLIKRNAFKTIIINEYNTTFFK